MFLFELKVLIRNFGFDFINLYNILLKFPKILYFPPMLFFYAVSGVILASLLRPECSVLYASLLRLEGCVSYYDRMTSLC